MEQQTNPLPDLLLNIPFLFTHKVDGIEWKVSRQAEPVIDRAPEARVAISMGGRYRATNGTRTIEFSSYGLDKEAILKDLLFYLQRTRQ